MDFRNTLIILTSNMGSEILANQPTGQDTEAVQELVMEAVRAALRPEFLNRIDEIILFHRLSRDHMDGIVDIQLARLEKLLADRHMTLEMDADAKAWLADKGYDSAYGARPLKRAIQQHLQNALAGLILEGTIKDGETVTVSADEAGLVIGGK